MNFEYLLEKLREKESSVSCHDIFLRLLDSINH
jgi:hypothetical protein